MDFSSVFEFLQKFLIFHVFNTYKSFLNIIFGFDEDDAADIWFEVDEDDYFLLTAIPEDLFSSCSYRSWMETFPMLLLYFAFFTNNFLAISYFIVILIDDFFEDFANPYHLDEIEEEDSGRMEVEDHDLFLFAFEFEFFDSHTYNDFDFFYYFYLNRFENNFRF